MMVSVSLEASHAWWRQADNSERRATEAAGFSTVAGAPLGVFRPESL